MKSSPAKRVDPAETPSLLDRSAFLQSLLLLNAWPGMQHGFSFGWPRLDDAGLAAAAAQALDLGTHVPWLLQQPHGPEILDLSGDEGKRLKAGLAKQRIPVPGYDGVLASVPADPAGARGDTLIVKAADCVSVLAVLREHRAYAALHVGWRGAAAGILPRLLTAWRSAHGSLAGARLAFGPHIRACCFEVKADCLAHFAASDLHGAVAAREGRTTLDLEHVLRTQAARFGVGEEQIDALPQCTQCHRDAAGAFPFASYRRSQREGQAAGRNIAFIGPAR